MGKFSLYSIPLKGLSEGKHEFKFILDKVFFSLIDDSVADIKKGNVDVILSLKKTATTFDLNFDISGEVYVPCDRCLDTVTMPVDTKQKLIVKFGTGYSEESDETVIIPEEDGEINIAWFLYEFIVLSLPAKRVHPPGSCNKAMSSKLNKHKVKDEDEGNEDDLDMAEDEDVSSMTDSRWDSLKDIVIDDE